jgi:hypothetical protein
VVGYPTTEEMMSPVNEYVAKIDTKKRVTLRGAMFTHYQVKEFRDGRITLEPRVIVTPFEVSRRTLKMMDLSMASFRNGVAGPAVENHPGRKRRSTD